MRTGGCGRTHPDLRDFHMIPGINPLYPQSSLQPLRIPPYPGRFLSDHLLKCGTQWGIWGLLPFLLHPATSLKTLRGFPDFRRTHLFFDSSPGKGTAKTASREPHAPEPYQTRSPGKSSPPFHKIPQSHKSSLWASLSRCPQAFLRHLRPRLFHTCPGRRPHWQGRRIFPHGKAGYWRMPLRYEWPGPQFQAPALRRKNPAAAACYGIFRWLNVQSPPHRSQPLPLPLPFPPDKQPFPV